MSAAACAVHILIVCRLGNFWELAAGHLDNASYLEIATIIQQGRVSGVEMPQHFWGFPYTIAAISTLFGMSGMTALVVASFVTSLAASFLVHRLYGGRVAAAFVFVNYQWIPLSVEGGSEPLFTAILYASFLAARSSCWSTAALLASLGTTVRPLGVFVLLAMGSILAMRRSYRQLAGAVLIGLLIGTIYTLHAWSIQGSFFASYARYRDMEGGWGAQGGPLTFPFLALVRSYFVAFHGARWTLVVLSLLWLVVMVVAVTRLWLPRSRLPTCAAAPCEVLFASMYALFLVSFNAPSYIAVSLPRYLLPVLPLLLVALSDWIPWDRRVLWAGTLLSALLASAAIVGFKNVFGFSLP